MCVVCSQSGPIPLTFHTTPTQGVAGTAQNAPSSIGWREREVHVPPRCSAPGYAVDLVSRCPAPAGARWHQSRAAKAPAPAQRRADVDAHRRRSMHAVPKRGVSFRSTARNPAHLAGQNSARQLRDDANSAGRSPKARGEHAPAEMARLGHIIVRSELVPIAPTVRRPRASRADDHSLTTRP